MATDSSSHHTRSSLLERARQNDAQAWRELVDLYGPLVAHWCRQCRIDAHAAADCVQDVFSSVALALPEFRPTRTAGSFRAWLWTITQNKLRDHFRRVARDPAAVGGSSALGLMQRVIDPIPVFDEEPTGDLQMRSLTARALNQVQGEFETRTWQAFWRSVVDGMTTEQVARELQLTPAVIRQSRCRILRRLRQQLGDLP
jgi:RNA polymerase sigma-70 factor (ECF subfamily)